MVWGQFSKNAISLPLRMGFKRVIQQMKDNICLYPNIVEKIKMNLKCKKCGLKTNISLLFLNQDF